MSERILSRLIIYSGSDSEYNLSLKQREALRDSRSLHNDASEIAKGRSLFGMGPGYEPFRTNQESDLEMEVVRKRQP